MHFTQNHFFSIKYIFEVSTNISIVALITHAYRGKSFRVPSKSSDKNKSFMYL